jgi:ribose transport system substrate-binding protein
MKKMLLLLFLAAILVFSFVGCSSDSEQTDSQTTSTESEETSSSTSSSETEVKKIKIGMSVLDLSNPYFKEIANGAQKAADELGIELVINDPKSDPTKQMDAVDNFIADKVDGVILTAVDKNQGNTSAEKLKEAGIPVLALIHPLDTDVDIFIKLDEYKYGQMGGANAGNWIKDKFSGQEVEVAILDYPKLPQIIDRANGIIDKIKEIAPNAKIVAQQSAATPEEGLKAMETILQANPNVKVVAAINDAGALGALEAFKAAGKTDENIFIGGLDATAEAVSKINEKGFYRATVDIDPNGTGALAVQQIFKLLNNESVEKSIDVPMNPVLAE